MSLDPEWYIIRALKQVKVGMHIRWIAEQRHFDYTIVDVSRKAKCAVVVKTDDARKHPNKMVLKNLHLFIKRGVILGEE